MNRIILQLSEIGDAVAVVDIFSHCVLFESQDWLVALYTVGVHGGGRVVDVFRADP